MELGPSVRPEESFYFTRLEVFTPRWGPWHLGVRGPGLSQDHLQHSRGMKLLGEGTETPPGAAAGTGAGRCPSPTGTWQHSDGRGGSRP